MLVFYTSPWVPPEFIKAHGLEPRGVWFASEPKQLPLAAGACAFAQAVVRLAENQADSAFVFSTHCDQLRRGFDVVAQVAPAQCFFCVGLSTSYCPAQLAALASFSSFG